MTPPAWSVMELVVMTFIRYWTVSVLHCTVLHLKMYPHHLSCTPPVPQVSGPAALLLPLQEGAQGGQQPHHEDHPGLPQLHHDPLQVRRLQAILIRNYLTFVISVSWSLDSMVQSLRTSRSPGSSLCSSQIFPRLEISKSPKKK